MESHINYFLNKSNQNEIHLGNKLNAEYINSTEMELIDSFSFAINLIYMHIVHCTTSITFLQLFYINQRVLHKMLSIYIELCIIEPLSIVVNLICNDANRFNYIVMYS